MSHDSSSQPDAQRGARPSSHQVLLRIALIAPNDDVASIQATVVGRNLPNGESPRPNLVEAARASVDSLLEPLRALGGESSTTAVVSEVTCTVPAIVPASRTP